MLLQVLGKMCTVNSNGNVCFCDIRGFGIFGVLPAIGVCWFERQLNLSVVVSECVV